MSVRKKIKKNERHNFENVESTTSTSGIEIEDKEGYIKEQFYFKEIFDDTKFKKFIKSIESTIRRSEAYKSFIGACHEKGLTKCAILGNVEMSEKVTIEMHHYPFTLYDIVYLCVIKHLKKDDNIITTSIAEEVLEDHIYNKIISVVPLSKTVHKLVHAGLIFISLDSCIGDLNGFLEKYKDELTPEMKESYNKILEMTENGINYSDEDILSLIGKLNPDDINNISKNTIIIESNFYQDDLFELNNFNEYDFILKTFN